MTTAPAVWMLRINPLARRRLADPDLAAVLARLVALEQTTERLASEAGDDLHALVPTVAGEERRRILALRRDIHNDRPSAALRSGALPFVAVPATVGRWAEHAEQRRQCREEIVGRYDDSLANERAGLRELLAEDDFLTTLAQSAPGVYEDACRYQRRDAVDSKDRKAERALVQFVTRAMVRTSPYGRFTAVGLAAPGPGGVALDAAVPDGATPQVEVDRVMFDYVVGGLLGAGPGGPRNPGAGDPWLMVPPTARHTDDRITFFQVGPTAMRRLAAPVTGHTRVLVDLLAAGPRRRSMLVAALADQIDVAPGEADQLVARALQVGLLVTAWRGDEFVANPIGAAIEDVRSADPAAGGPQGALEALRRFEAAVDRLRQPLDAPGAAADHHRVSVTGEELSRLAQRPARLAVYEDFVLEPFTVDPSRHHAALDDLAAVTEMLSAFDRMHVVRAVLAGALVDRFGPGCRVPLVANAEHLVRSVYRAERLLDEAPDALVGPSDASVAVLAKVQAAARRALQESLATGDADDVRWQPADVVELVGDLPERFRTDPASYGLVVQPAGTDLVVNDTYAGHGPMVSRFLHADAVRGGDATARLGDRLAALYGTDAHLLEDLGCHGLSINTHPRIVVGAGAGQDDSFAGVDAERWMRFHLRHDADTDTVAIVDGDEPVRVLTLGAQLPEFLPYPARLASWLSSSGRVLLDLAGQVPRPGGTVTVGFPRLRVGRVILARRRWYLGEDFPARPDYESDTGYLLELARWRGRCAVPAEVVVKSAFDGPTMWDNLSAAGPRDRFLELRRQAKPQYVDLESALMARILPRLLERRPPGYVEEALPAVAGGGHALEWMIEMRRVKGRPGFDWRDPCPEPR